MRHPDEGTIHAWLDGALAPEEALRLEEHVASCAACGEAVAEARGLVAASSRIIGALDALPGDVVPRAPQRGRSDRGSGRARWWTRPLIPAAAAAVLVVAVSFGLLGRPAERIASVDRRAAIDAASAMQAETAGAEQLRAETLNERSAIDADALTARQGEDESIGSASTARAPQIAAAAETPARSSARGRDVAEGAVVEAAPPPAAPVPAEVPHGYAVERDAEVSERTLAGRVSAREDAGRAADLPRAPVTPDTTRRRMAELAVPETAPAPAPARAPGTPDTSRTERADLAITAPALPLAIGHVDAMTDDTSRVQLVVASQRADTNLVGVIHTTVYAVRPGIQVTHQAVERRFQLRREQPPADTSAEDDAAGERTLLKLDMDRVQAIHWTDAAGVYHTLSGPVEQEELARIRAAIRERAREQ